jgi:hypothetical protein
MAKQTQQRTVNKYGQVQQSTSMNASVGERTSQSTRNSSGESIRDLTTESVGNSRDIQRANIAMQITFTVPITSKIPVNLNANC